MPLSVALGLDTYVVCSHALEMPLNAACIGAGVSFALLAAWLVFPLIVRARREKLP